MAYSILPARIQNLGFCCPYSYFFTTRKLSHAQVAQELLCSKVSVRKWRNRKLACPDSESCFLRSTSSLDQCRAKRLAASAGTDPVQVSVPLSDFD